MYTTISYWIQWGFGGVEREAGRTFLLVVVPDRSAVTLLNAIRTWIEPVTTIISDCWGACVRLQEQGYTHRTVNHTISFADQRTSDHTSSTEGKWRHV
jgi:hypothetical protein